MKTKELYSMQDEENFSPIWAYLAAKGFIHEKIDNENIYAGLGPREIIFCGTNKTSFLCITDEIRQTSERLAKYTFDNPKHILKIKKIFLKESKELIRFISRLKKINYDMLTTGEMIEIFAELERIYTKCFSCSKAIIYFTENYQDQVKRTFIKDYQGTEDDFKNLTQDPELNYKQKEVLDMLLIKEKKEDIMKKRQLLQKHKEKYEWMPYGYGNSTYSYEHFENEYSRFDIKKNIYLKSFTDKTNKEIVQLEDIYNLDKKAINQLEAIRALKYLTLKHEETFTQLHFYSAPFFEKIAKRLNTGTDIAKAIYPSELKDALNNKAEALEKIKERNEAFYLVVKKDSTEEKTGKGAISLIKKFKE